MEEKKYTLAEVIEIKAEERRRCKEAYLKAFRGDGQFNDTGELVEWWLKEMDALDRKVMDGTYGKK